jgi:hypothetical protein
LWKAAIEEIDPEALTPRCLEIVQTMRERYKE